MDVDQARVEEGWHPAKLVKVDDHESKEGNEGWRYVAELSRGRFKGHSYAIYCGLSSDQLWKIRNLAVAVGLTVPKKVIGVDPNKLLNREFGLFLADDEYEGREQSKPAKPLFAQLDEVDDDMWADPKVAALLDGSSSTEPEEEAEEEEPEETPPPRRAAKAAAPKKRSRQEPEEDEEVEEIDLDEI